MQFVGSQHSARPTVPSGWLDARLDGGAKVGGVASAPPQEHVGLRQRPRHRVLPSPNDTSSHTYQPRTTRTHRSSPKVWAKNQKVKEPKVETGK